MKANRFSSIVKVWRKSGIKARGLAALGLLAMLALAPFTDATIIVVQPISATANPDGLFSFFFADQTRNGSGLTVNYATGDAVPGTWSTQSASQADEWMTGSPNPAGYITWDLGQVYNVTGFHMWNFNDAGVQGRGLLTADVKVNTVNNFTSGFTDLGTFNFVVASGTASDTGWEYPASFTGQFVQFSNLVPQNAGPYAGLSEIRFEADVILIPEPSMVMLFGIGAGILWLRRRKIRE